MLDSEIIKKIEEFVSQKPRSIQEISKHINKNWRTADRYIEEIESNFGTLSTRVFRGGTRGALKIVYWSAADKIKHSVFQESLEKLILSGRSRDDFSPFDIYQYVDKKHKETLVKTAVSEEEADLDDLKRLLESTKKQLIIFSGNLSFIQFKNKRLGIEIFKVIEELVKRGVSIKVICRVDISGKDNIKRLLSLNFKYGKELIEIRHRDQPLRATIIDKTLFNMKEVKEPTGRSSELKEKTFIFYTIKDKEWTDWLTNIFWRMFNSSIGADKRLSEIKGLC